MRDLNSLQHENGISQRFPRFEYSTMLAEYLQQRAAASLAA